MGQFWTLHSRCPFLACQRKKKNKQKKKEQSLRDYWFSKQSRSNTEYMPSLTGKDAYSLRFPTLSSVKLRLSFFFWRWYDSIIFEMRWAKFELRDEGHFRYSGNNFSPGHQFDTIKHAFSISGTGEFNWGVFVSYFYLFLLRGAI